MLNSNEPSFSFAYASLPTKTFQGRQFLFLFFFGVFSVFSVFRSLTPSSSALAITAEGIQENPWPKHIVWLLSFPNSGTTYTTDLIRIGSATATATNYGVEMDSTIPFFEKSEKGPFRGSRRPFPKDFILTKTHCAGHIVGAPPKNYMQNLAEFILGCCLGAKKKSDGTGNVGVRYGTDIVKKSVHLIRSPFDNMVANFHFDYKAHSKDSNWKYAYDQNGFKQWCTYMDEKYAEEERELYSDDVLMAAEGVPCHGALFQYVNWHNNAFDSSAKLAIPHLVQYYEDYHFNMERSLSNLLDFLNLPFAGEIAPFKWNGGYGDHFTQEERINIISFVKYIASKETIDFLSRYFHDEPINSM